MPTDNVEVTPGSGAVIRSEDVGLLVQVQVVKPAYGAPNSATDVDLLTPMPVRAGIPKTQITTPVSIAAAGSGDNLVLAATALMTIRVHRLLLQNKGTQSVNFKLRSNTTDLHPALTLKPGQSFTLDFDGEPWFVTAAGEALNLNLDAAVSIAGSAWLSKSA